MAERYTRLFSLSENLYASGAPVLIAAGALLKDNQTGKTLAQLKFKSLSEKNIKALKVTIAASDVSGNALTGVDEYQYLDLAVERNETFGQKQAVYLPDAVTRSFTAKCTEVVFEDGSVWKAAEDAIWNTLPEQETIEDCLKDLSAQYQRDTSRLSKYALVEHEDLWLCTCGAINHNEEAVCHRCNYEKAELLEAMDLEGLQARKADYDREAAEAAEKRAREAAERAEKKAAEDKVRRAKTKKIGIIAAAAVLLIVVAYVLITSIFIPNGHYNDALALMNAGKYTEAIAAFNALDGYKDSTNKINECNIAILDGKYNDAIALMNEGKYLEAISAFEELNSYQDSKNKINECNIAILDEKYNEAEVLMEAKQYDEAIVAFEMLGDHRESAAKITECETAILDAKYNDALLLINNGMLEDAYDALIALGDYRDSLQIADSIFGACNMEKLKSAQIGDYVYLGTYEQDNNTSNGTENIEWIVLAKEGSKILVISRFTLDAQPYHTSAVDVTWQTCTLRKWLNNDFLYAAFSEDERKLIPSVTLTEGYNSKYEPYVKLNNSSTQDYVFLLSLAEAEQYFTSDSARKCEATKYVISKGVDRSSNYCTWWLRSRTHIPNCSLCVWANGSTLSVANEITTSKIGVRPALWIDLSKIN